MLDSFDLGLRLRSGRPKLTIAITLFGSNSNFLLVANAGKCLKCNEANVLNVKKRIFKYLNNIQYAKIM